MTIGRPRSKASRGPSGNPARIVFWQPIVSPHQRDFLETLASAFPGEVILAAERGLPPERADQGWETVRHERVRVEDVSVPAAFEALVADAGPDSLHVFSGFFSHRIVWRAFARLEPSRARLAMLSEAPEQGPLTGALKRTRGRWLVRRRAPRLEFALAIGGVGMDFFRAVGFPAAKLEPFGYHLSVPAHPWPEAAGRDRGEFRFVAAGQLIRRKGFDLLVEAMARLPAGGWRCDLHGAGPERHRLGASLVRHGLEARVAIRPTLPNEELRRLIASADCTVAPSRFDGWGVVVNESLIAGTPVVCSSACGAAVILDDSIAGGVFPAGNVAALTAALRERLSCGTVDLATRRLVHAVARRHGPEAAVARFLEIVARSSRSDSRPLPPDAHGVGTSDDVDRTDPPS